MPSSQYYHISKIMEVIIASKPESILDVGTGFGKYGVLCREYLDLWDGRQKYEFSRRIDGVEAFQNYITPLHKFVYNNIYNEDILHLNDKLELKYDIVLLIDVLEHFEKQQGRYLLDKLLDKNIGIIISTPKKPSPQKDAFGNIYETHRSSWSVKDLKSLGYSFFINDVISFICYITRYEDAFIKTKQNIIRMKEIQRPFHIRPKMLAKNLLRKTISFVNRI